MAGMRRLLCGSLPRSPCRPPAPFNCPPGGMSRFYRGFSPCLMRAAPANAVMLFTVDKVRAVCGWKGWLLGVVALVGWAA